MSPTEVLDTIRPTLASWYADYVWSGAGSTLTSRLASLSSKWAAYDLSVKRDGIGQLLASISGSTFCLEMNPSIPAAFDISC